MAKIGLGIKALILSVGFTGAHFGAHTTGQSLQSICGEVVKMGRICEECRTHEEILKEIEKG